MQATGSPATRLLIVGGGTAGWMTAAALSRLLPRHRVSIALVESAEIGTVGVGEATVPHIRFFNEKLGFDEADFMARTQATYKLGIEFRNWGRKGDSYIHPFGVFGEEIDGVDFHHHYVRARTLGLADTLEDFSLPVQAARRNRFRHPEMTDETTALSTFSYAFQFDASLYAAYLRAYAEARGVVRHEGRITDAVKDGETGDIRSVTLADGRSLEADFFVDCSGFRGLLIGQTLGVPYEEWTRWLPCDRAWAVPCEGKGPAMPYTRATAHEAGWMWRIPLQHRVGNGHVFSSAFTDEQAALDALLDALDNPPQMEPKQLRFTTGKRARQWERNVVAIGLASGFLEPLESTSIHLIQLAIGYLADLFPANGEDPVCRDEFNRIMALEYERIRDFLILHYHATERDDTGFWNHCRTMSIPDSLAYKMEVFRERGVVVKYREGMFLDASWLAVYFGQRLLPKRHDPLAARLGDDALAAHIARIRKDYAALAERLPRHADYLRHSGAAHRAAE